MVYGVGRSSAGREGNRLTAGGSAVPGDPSRAVPSRLRPLEPVVGPTRARGGSRPGEDA